LNDRYALRLSVDPAPLACRTLVLSAGLADSVRRPAGQDAAVASSYGGSYRALADAAHCMMFGPHTLTAFDALLDWHRRTNPS